MRVRLAAVAGEKRRSRGLNGGQRRLEFMRNSVEQRGLQLLVLARCFRPIRQLVSVLPFDSDGHEIRKRVNHRFRDARSQNRNCADALPPQRYWKRDQAGRGVLERGALHCHVFQTRVGKRHGARSGAMNLAGRPIVERNTFGGENTDASSDRRSMSWTWAVSITARLSS